MAVVEDKGHDQSARLAEERGPFANWPRSIYRAGRPIRNSTVTTIAPTGTISMIAGCSSGIEPVFALAFEHRAKGPDTERVLRFVSQSFERLGRERGFYSDALMGEVARRGSLHGIPGVPDEARAVFKTAHEIHWSWHVRHQAAFQRHTDNGVSKTINLPAEAAEGDVSEAYLMAWREGCLGITVFRDGCKGGQVLHVGIGEGAAVGGNGGTLTERVVKPRPHSLAGATYRMETPIGTAFITVNETPGGDPFEVFVQVGKAGSDTMAVAEALGRLISLVLRLPSPLSAQRRLEEVISQLSRIGGGQPTGFGAAKVREDCECAFRLGDARGISERRNATTQQSDAVPGQCQVQSAGRQHASRANRRRLRQHKIESSFAAQGHQGYRPGRRDLHGARSWVEHGNDTRRPCPYRLRVNRAAEHSEDLAGWAAVRGGSVHHFASRGHHFASVADRTRRDGADSHQEPAGRRTHDLGKGD